MTWQQIVESITRHRANPLVITTGDRMDKVASEIQRKANEIEWALQAIAEKLRDEAGIEED